MFLLRDPMPLFINLCTVDGSVISSIGRGLCILVGVSRNDTAKEMEYM